MKPTSVLGWIFVSTGISLLLGMVTNRIVAHSLGVEGVAVYGAYRSVTNIVLQIALLGYLRVFAHKMSVSHQARAEADVLSGAVVLLLSGFVISMILSFVFVKFAAFPFVNQVVTLSVGAIVFHLCLTLIHSRGGYRLTSMLQILVASVTALFAFLFLNGMDDLVLLVSVGYLSISLVALVVVLLSFRHLWKSLSIRTGWHFLKGHVAAAGNNAIQTFCVGLGLLAVQERLATQYQLLGLGNFNAAMAMIEIFVLVLVSFQNAYVLPSLGRLPDLEAKERFIQKTLGRSVLVMAVIGILLFIFSDRLITVVFSEKFLVASRLLRILIPGLLGLTLCWTANTFLLHAGKHGWIMRLDVAWIILYAGFVSWFSMQNFSLEWNAWAFSIISLLIGLVYCALTQRNGSRLRRRFLYKTHPAMAERVTC